MKAPPQIYITTADFHKKADEEILMTVHILAFLIGAVAGLRAMSAPAAVSCCPSRLAESRKHLAGISRLRLDAVYF